MNRVITCHNVDIAYRRSDGGQRCILEAVYAEFNPGQLTLVSGDTGAGKSSLLHVLAGLMRPTQGEVRVDGEPVSRWVSIHRDQWRRQVGIVFQFQSLLADLTVMENVLLPMIPRRVSLKDCRRRARHLLSRLGIDHLQQESTATLSGGQRQRAAVARALISEPAFFFADEPTAYQDRRGAETILSLLTERAQTDCVVVVASHDPRVLQSGCPQRHYRLQNRRVVERS